MYPHLEKQIPDPSYANSSSDLITPVNLICVPFALIRFMEYVHNPGALARKRQKKTQQQKQSNTERTEERQQEREKETLTYRKTDDIQKNRHVLL